MSAANCFGSLLAIYYFIGRWTFARLDGDYALVPMVSQPRFWLVALLVAFALVIQSSTPRRARQFRPTGVDFAILAFLSYMLLTALWAPDAELAGAKAFEVALMLAVASVLIATRAGGLDDHVHVGFWTTIVAIGVVLGALSLSLGGDARAFAPGGGPNTFGRNMGLSAIGALYLASRFGVIARIGSIGLFATAAMLVVRCGSRGGLLSFGVAAATYTITSKTRIANRVLLIAAVSTVTAAALFYTQAGQQAVEVFGGRIIEQTVENRYLSGRDELWFMSLDMTREQPIMGWGLNGFRAMSTFYPHNIFLEVMVEGGSIGLLLLLNAGWAWWRNFRRHRHLISRFDLAALALLFTAAQTSGDLYDSRGIFLVLALSLPAAQLIQRRPSRQSGTVPVRRKPAAALAPAMPSVTNHKPRERRA